METTVSNILTDSHTYSKFTGFVKLTKFRLGALVVFSAIITYFTVTETVLWTQLLALSLGGFLVTSAANGFNQIIEKDLDKLMDRTKDRPMPTEVLSINEAFAFCTVFGIGGTILLWVYTNPLCGILGFLSIILYALLYTPLKRKTPFSVFVGAFPGALPTLIGGVAATKGFGEINFFTLLLFMIQFIWQFPHFWALAWFNNDDYAKADFHLLPSKGGKDAFSKFQILLYSVFLLVMSILPFVFHFVGLISTIACVICGLALLLQAYNFYRLPTNEHAKKLFLITLIYLPLVQVALMTKA
ncbi:heme o synthase [Aurantibacillus circumpalustris]|uniref:heme o synthase n=1 Tax=Aurantibacillus circumpalustris TaxID=3036359 RepID=UPI00295B4AA6|nr:heme o synthase [Aurantibacillus circumpalustris]